jgi:hypothetical protein
VYLNSEQEICQAKWQQRQVAVKRLSDNTFFDAFLENFVRKKSEIFLKN